MKKAVLILLVSAPVWTQTAGRYTVCQALEAASVNEIEIIGKIEGFSHGFYLSDEGGAPCARKGPDGGVFPPAVAVSWGSALGVKLTGEEERESRAFELKVYRLSRETRKSPGLRVVIRGVLIRKEGVRIVRLADGSYRGNGYGQDGAFPAVLVARKVREEGK